MIKYKIQFTSFKLSAKMVKLNPPKIYENFTKYELLWVEIRLNNKLYIFFFLSDSYNSESVSEIKRHKFKSICLKHLFLRD